jgi:hypothetical protein
VSDFIEDKDTPRLVKAINTAPVPGGSYGLSSERDTVAAILQSVVVALRGGLDQLWLCDDGGFRGRPIDSLGLSADELAEERWARKVAEMLVLQPYNAAGTWYKSASQCDPQFFEAMFRAGGPYPIGAACQQLCTFNLWSRGFDWNDVKPGVNAGDGNSGNTKLYVDWTADDEGRDPRTAFSRSNGKPAAAPGSMYQFFTVSNQGAAHVGFILRIHNSGWKGIQVLDTGALGISIARATNVPLVSAGGFINFDDPWLTNHVVLGPAMGNAGETYRGLLSLKPSSLPTGMTRMSAAWPLGLARLLVFRRQPRELLWASGLLPMHTNDDSFAITRYAWSLRNYKDASKFEAVWRLYLPINTAADLYLAPSVTRTTRLGRILQQLELDELLFFDDRPLNRNTVFRTTVPAPTDPNLHLESVILPFINFELRHAASGSSETITVVAHQTSLTVEDGADALPWRTTSGKYSDLDPGDYFAETFNPGRRLHFTGRFSYTNGRITFRKPAWGRYVGEYEDRDEETGDITTGKVTEAFRSDQRLTGKWANDRGGARGTFDLTFAADSSSFDGTWTVDGPPPVSGPLKANRVPFVDGKFFSTFGEMIFRTDSSGHVTGTYAGGSPGKIDGDFDNRLLKGRWTNDNKRAGTFELRFAPDFYSFVGTFKADDDGRGGDWIGVHQFL